MKSKQSKAERVKEVKQVLARFSVDITQIHLAVHSSTIDISGVLLKYSGDDFNAGELCSLVDALASYGHLSTTLTNWDLTNGEVRKLSSAHTA